MIGSRVGIEKLLLNTETVNRLERYWNFLLDIILFLDPIVIFNRSNALLPTVKLYVENVDNLSRQQFVLWRTTTRSRIFSTEHCNLLARVQEFLLGSETANCLKSSDPSPDNEGLNIKNCILAARTLNVPLFYGDTWAESKMASRPSNAIRPPAFLSLGQAKL